MKGAEYLILITLILSILYTIGFFDYPQMKYNFRVIFNFFPVLGYFIMGSYIHNKQFKYSDKKMFAIGCIMFIIGIAGHFAKIYLKGLGGFTLAPIDFFDICVIMETIGLFIAFKYASTKWIKEDARMIRVMYNSFLSPVRKMNPFIWLPVSSVILIGLSWLLIFIMSQIPLLKIGSGRK